MTLFYPILADAIVVIHVAYVSYVVFGQLAIMIGYPLRWRWIRNPWFRCTHLAMILIVAFEALISFECPLTTWEYKVRVAAGQQAEEASFVARLMWGVLFWGSSSEPVPESVYYVAAGIVVATLILVPPRFRRQAAPAVPQPAATRETVTKPTLEPAAKPPN